MRLTSDILLEVMSILLLEADKTALKFTIAARKKSNNFKSYCSPDHDAVAGEIGGLLSLKLVL